MIGHSLRFSKPPAVQYYFSFDQVTEMQVCPICGSRWDTDDPFCPSCSVPPEEQEPPPDDDASLENGKRDSAERESGPERRNNGRDSTERESGPERRNGKRDSAELDNGPEREEGAGYGRKAENGNSAVNDSGVHPVVNRNSVPPPRSESRPSQPPPPNELEEEGATAYGSAVLAQGEIEEEVVIPDEAPVEPEERTPSDPAPDPSEGESVTATSASQSARPPAGSESEEAARERSRDSQPPKKPAKEGPPPRPPVLASEALRKEVAPQEPGRMTMRALLLFAGLTGSVSSLLLMRFTGMGVPLAGAFIGLTLLGLPPIPYAARAVAAVTIAGCALGVVTWMNLAQTGSSAVVAESIGLTLLAAALFFRAWHRGSTLARFLVLVGLVVSASWLGTSGALAEMTTLDPWWQSWLPIVLRAPLGLLMMLSLLAFMDERSTGGCEIWATGVVLWAGTNSGVQLLVRFWPPALDAPDWSLVGGGESVPIIAGPLLMTLVAFGTAQLLAVTAAAEQTPRKEDDEP